SQIGEVDLVELEIAAAGIREGAHHFPVGLAEIGVELVHGRIDRRRHRLAAVAEMQRRGRRDGHLRRRLGVLGDEAEVLDHRVAVDAAEPALEAQQDRPRLRALELELALAPIGLDAGERGEEIGLPRRAAIFAVGDRPEAGGFLLADQRDDLAVLDGAQRSRVDLAALALRPRRLQRRRAQQAAAVAGAKWRRGALHGSSFSLSPPNSGLPELGIDSAQVGQARPAWERAESYDYR